MATGRAPGYGYTGQAKHRMSYGQVKQLARAFGLPGDAIAQIAKGESGLYADVQQRDPGDGNVGYGLLQMTPNAWGKGTPAAKYLEHLGGVSAMKDPVKNMAMARFLYKSAGNKLTPWYGTRFLTNRSGEGTLGPIDHSRIDGNLANAVTPAETPVQPSLTRTVQTTTPGVDNSQARAALVQGFLGNKKADVLDFALQARNLKDIAPTTTSKVVAVGAPGASGATPVDRGANAGGGAAQALSWAESKLGAPGSHESGGANQGKLAGFLNQRFGMSGAPWCAMFTSAAVTKGGAPPEARTASVAAVRQKAQSGQGYVRGFIPAQHARAGDLVLFGNSHIAMVKGVSGGKISYVGGNQSDNVTSGSTSVGAGVSIVRPKYGAR